MRARLAFGALGAIDARSVARDSLLRGAAILSPATGLLFRFAVPPIAAALQAQYGFDLTKYYPLLMSFLPLTATGMIGTVVGFLLLDQRDEGTLTALLVTPLSLGNYLLYRLGLLLAVSVVICAVTLLLGGLTKMTASQIIVTSLVAAPLAPISALGLGSFASNKVQGFALAKGGGIVIAPCVAAYFVAGPWQNAFGVVPVYWPLKVFWLFDAGEPLQACVHGAIGLAWMALVIVVLSRYFARIVRR